ncbi:MAG: NosD domain-containing protein [Saprospiraceae bacterium]
MKSTKFFLLASALLMVSLISCSKENISTNEMPPPVGSYITGSHLMGTLKGSLKQDSTYYLDGDMIVNATDSFAISPGVKVIATGNYHIEIAGVFICKGTEAKQITLTTNDEAGAYANLGQTGYWGGILVDSTASYVCINFTHINYTGGPDAGGSAQASFDVEGSQTFNGGAKIIFEDNWMFGGIDDAIHLAGDITCSIKRNVLQRLGGSDGDVVNIKKGAHGVFAYNYIWSSGNSGIKLNTSKTVPLPETKFDIYNNTFVNGNWRKIGELSAAIYLDQNSAGNIYNNAIVGCRNGIHLAKNATGADMANTKYSNNLIYMYYDLTSDSSNVETNNPYIQDSNGVPQPTDKIAYGLGACHTVFTKWDQDITANYLDLNVPSLPSTSPARNGGTSNGILFGYLIGADTPLNRDMGAYPSDGKGNKHLPTSKP